ncbi:MAG: hypothetical protein GY754_22555 [bacterium]|nr:hypothetical protein [bacterium]
MLLLVTVFITLITVLYFFESKINNQYGDWLRVSVSLTGFIIGFSLSFVFRVYLITIILNRMGLEVEFNNIGMVVAFAMITNIFMFLILIFIQTAAFDTYIGVIFNYTGHK